MKFWIDCASSGVIGTGCADTAQARRSGASAFMGIIV